MVHENLTSRRSFFFPKKRLGFSSLGSIDGPGAGSGLVHSPPRRSVGGELSCACGALLSLRRAGAALCSRESLGALGSSGCGAEGALSGARGALPSHRRAGAALCSRDAFFPALWPRVCSQELLGLLGWGAGEGALLRARSSPVGARGCALLPGCILPGLETPGWVCLES